MVVVRVGGMHDVGTVLNFFIFYKDACVVQLGCPQGERSIRVNIRLGRGLGHPQGECPSHIRRDVYGRGIPLAGALVSIRLF